MKTIRKSAHGGARPGAGRPRGSRTRKAIELPPGEFDAEAVLRSIAVNSSAPASARVAAAKALLRPTAAAPGDGAPEPLARDLNAKALQLMGVKGHA